MSSDSHISVDLDDDNDDIEEIQPPPRPMGNDKVKGKGNATSSNSSVKTGRSTKSEEMIVQMTQLNTTFDKHTIETDQLMEYSLLMHDHNGKKIQHASSSVASHLHLRPLLQLATPPPTTPDDNDYTYFHSFGQ
ncbi:unnamed protein product [Lactuca saligna]|uniref:Uncharacterized protein n=1 Tax=Lactuca saligna TaxID=75948 RepID=A0AA35Y6M8_LACSI|nr:unnamed protein product [Lactuca saligna]